MKTGSCSNFLYRPLTIFQKGVYRTTVFHVGFVTLQELVRNGGQQPQEKGTMNHHVRLSQSMICFRIKVKSLAPGKGRKVFLCKTGS